MAQECVGRTPGRHYVWLCRCDCGGALNVTRGHLLSGSARSCGCTRTQREIGQSVGSLTLVNRVSQGGGIAWGFTCVCGGSGMVLDSALHRRSSCGRCSVNRAARGVGWCKRHGELPLSEFHREASSPTGHASLCKRCVHQYAHGRYRVDIDKSRAARRAHSLAEDPRRLRERRQAMHWAVRHAHLEVMRAIKRGDLTRPEGCSRCGDTHRVEAHHDDYAEPLSVIWLCTACHRVRHQELASQGIDPQRRTRHLKKKEPHERNST